MNKLFLIHYILLNQICRTWLLIQTTFNLLKLISDLGRMLQKNPLELTKGQIGVKPSKYGYKTYSDIRTHSDIRTKKLQDDEEEEQLTQ